MSIFWERCDVCGRHRPTRQCWLHPERSVCPYCCIACPERPICPKPAWYPQLRVSEARPERRPPPRGGEARKALEDLLRRLEGG